MEHTIEFMQLRINALEAELAKERQKNDEAKKIIEHYLQTIEVIADAL
jgi:hypothetical protein